MKIKTFTLSIFLTIALILSGCIKTTKEPIEKTGIHFDTVISIRIYDSNDSSILDECFSHCAEFEQLISRTIKSSEIYKLNHASGNPVTVSDTTLELLKKGIEYGDLTDGKFDITVAPLSELWDFKNNTGCLPSEEDIKEALSHVNYKNIQINGNQVTLTDPKSAIDLGGIAKGYMADQLKDYLLSKGVKSALINLGGNMLTVGSKPDGSKFNIGIQKPFDKQGSTITSVSVSDTSVVSSGVYERYFEVENTIYHHILNTENGYPYNNGLLSVSILSTESVVGDALSTACFALGLEDGLKLIRSLEGIDAIFITEDFKIHDTRFNEN